MKCNECLRYEDCTERRGICKDYDTEETRRERVREQIESLREKLGASKRPETDKAREG